MKRTLRQTMVISLILAAILFIAGYYFYQGTLEEGGFIEVDLPNVTEEPNVTISGFSHNASAPIGRGAAVLFEVNATPGSSVEIRLEPSGREFPVPCKAGTCSVAHTFDYVDSSAEVVATAVASIGNVTESMRAGSPVRIDLDPPELDSIRISARDSIAEGEPIKITVLGEPGARVAVGIETFALEMRATEKSPGVYSTSYTIMRGDDRSAISITARATDSAGNIGPELSSEFVLEISTSGPQLLGLEANETLPLKYGKVVEFTLLGEPGGIAKMHLAGLALDIQMPEVEAGRYYVEYTIATGGIERDVAPTIHLTKDGVTSSKVYRPITVDTVVPRIAWFGHTAVSTMTSGSSFEIVMDAEPNGIASFSLENTSKRLHPLGNGTYTYTYAVAGENIESQPVYGRFWDSAMNEAPMVQANERITIDTTAPAIAGFEYSGPPIVGKQPFNITLTAEEGGTATFSIPTIVKNTTIAGDTAMPEVEPGVYRATYAITLDNASVIAMVNLRFTDGSGNSAPMKVFPITIDTLPPTIADVSHNATGTLSVGSIIGVSMWGEAGGSARFELWEIATGYTTGAGMVETSPGVYSGTYVIQGNDTLGKAAVVGYLEDAQGNPAEPFIVKPVPTESPFQLTTLIAATLLMLVVPIFFYYYQKHKAIASCEESFPDFLSDLHSVMGSQLPLPKGIEIIRNSDYGMLSNLVNRMNNRIGLGVPFPDALKKFGVETHSASIKSAVAVLISAYKAGGGRLGQIFGATAFNFRRIRNLKKERLSEMQIHVVTGYLIFVIFLVVLVVLNNTLFSTQGPMAPTPFATLGVEANEVAAGSLAEAILALEEQPMKSRFTDVLFYLFFIQAFFSGIAIGELTEGNFMAGLKHAVILMIIALFAANFLV